MIIIRAESMSEAEKIVDQDPLAQAGLITFETAQTAPADSVQVAFLCRLLV